MATWETEYTIKMELALDSGVLSDWEENFIDGVLTSCDCEKWQGKPSPNQWKTIQEIIDRHEDDLDL